MTDINFYITMNNYNSGSNSTFDYLDLYAISSTKKEMDAKQGNF